MLCLVYDGSYDGFLSAVFDAFVYKNQETMLVNPKFVQPPALFSLHYVRTDRGKLRRLSAGMQKLGRDVEATVYRAWLSELPGADDDILASLKLGFAEKKNPGALLWHDCAKKTADRAHKVGYEVHRFLGYIRFHSLSENQLIADIEPDYNILALIGNHFHARFGSQQLVIRDLRRRQAVISGPAGWYVAQLTEKELVPLVGGDEYEDMWQSYFIHIANQKRRNLRLQQQFVPKKYRKHIVEFNQKEG